jgi:predicted RNA-binding Zn-ribbon protein involved in translation (DUF1610 family)
MHAKPRLAWRCPHCAAEERLDVRELAGRLRTLGMLKREDEREADFLLQLARAAGTRLLCTACGCGGVKVEIADDEIADDHDEWEPRSTPCAACGAKIPPERLALFPESDLCAACQARIDQGQSPDRHDDFCPRCGSRMVVRQRRSRGIAGYEQVCPDCGR